MNGTLAVTFGSLGGPALTGSGVGSSGGAGGIAALPASGLKFTSPASAPITPPVNGLSLITVPASPLAPLALVGTAPGALGNNGVANLFFVGGGLAGFLPLGLVGGGGTVMTSVGGIPWTVVGATWTNLGIVGTGMATTVIMNLGVPVPVTITATAFDYRTAGGLGTVQFVAPASAKLLGGSLGTLPVVGVLTLQFVPEPGTLLLVGSGLVFLVALGRRKSA